MQLSKFYQERVTTFSKEAEELKAKYNHYSIIRLVVFLGGLGVIVLVGTILPLWGLIIVIPIALMAFSKFVNWHKAIQEAQLHHESLAKVNLYEDRCVQNDYAVFGNGEEFIDPAHPYTVDLDIFGDHSFYQYINRTSTAIGKIRLAEYLKTDVDLQEIYTRQEAITELKTKTDWRHHFQASGMHTDDDLNHLKSLQNWMKAEPFVLNNSFYRLMPYVAPFLFVAGAVITFLYFPWYVFLIFITPAAYVLKKTLEQVNETHASTANAGKILAAYARMIERIETESFQSPKLTALKSLFLKKEDSASKTINRLSYIISQLNVRYNAFVVLLNVFVLWDLIWIKKLEQWKAEQGESLENWFEGLREFEALNSFGNLYFNNQEWIFPAVGEQASLVGLELGHPLIPGTVRVANNLKMPTQGHIKLVTGSNMAGKSTFLRTVGLNIVLAMAGSPVCAKEFSLPIIRVFTSMRTQDALHESTSSFYAELKRLKFIIEEVEDRKLAKTDIFFLLDEILKGTNSTDRHTGSKALIRQLIRSKGAGIIATHDLELAALEAESNGTVENLCIEVEVKNGKLFFDYTIKPGVSQSFNATQLMKDMGIRINEEIN